MTKLTRREMKLLDDMHAIAREVARTNGETLWTVAKSETAMSHITYRIYNEMHKLNGFDNAFRSFKDTMRKAAKQSTTNPKTDTTKQTKGSKTMTYREVRERAKTFTIEDLERCIFLLNMKSRWSMDDRTHLMAYEHELRERMAE